MSIKVENILKHYEAKGRVVIKLDKSSGTTQLTITKGVRRTNLIGTQPGGTVRSALLSDIRATLEANSIYIESWK